MKTMVKLMKKAVKGYINSYKEVVAMTSQNGIIFHF